MAKRKVKVWFRVLAFLIFLGGAFASWNVFTESSIEDNTAPSSNPLGERIILLGFTALMGWVALTGEAGAFGQEVQLGTIPPDDDQSSIEPRPEFDRIGKVRLYLDGSVTIDDKHVDLDDLNESFTDIASKNGALWIYGETLDMERLPAARPVLEEAGKLQLPILFSSEEDFSDVE